MKVSGIITLTTDFGTKDGYVGTMKGVMLSINSNMRLVDISHDIPPQDVRSGAILLKNSCPFYPPGTIHLVVVDPGVGTARHPLVVCTENAYFVLPDNGLISLVERVMPIQKVIVAENRNYWLPRISNSFHGRDIFAPMAAHLSLGVSPADMGRPLETWQRLDFPEPVVRGNVIEGEITHVDIYGNAVSNIPESMVKDRPENLVLHVADRALKGLMPSYGAAGVGELMMLWGSSGYLEVSVNRGSAAIRLGLQVGMKVTLRVERG